VVNTILSALLILFIFGSVIYITRGMD